MVNYGYNEFDKAVGKLLLDKGRIKERLAKAIREIRIVGGTQIENLELRERYEAVMSKVSPGKTVEKIEELSEDEAVELADEICAIWRRLAPHQSS